MPLWEVGSMGAQRIVPFYGGGAHGSVCFLVFFCLRQGM